MEWIKILKTYKTDRANILLLEATFLKQGIDGVKKISREWKDKQPRGYLYWIKLVSANADWESVIKIAKKALSVLKQGRFRGSIANEFIFAGEKIKNPIIILAGKRELFYSVPEIHNLIKLIEEAKNQNKRNIEMKNVLKFLNQYKNENSALEIIVLLMHGDLYTAFLKAKKTNVLGWSYSSKDGAVLFAGILTALVKDKIQEAEIIKLILKRYTIENGFYNYSNQDQEEYDLFIYNEIIEGLKDISITDTQQSSYIRWMEKIGKKRIEGIVSNKHRKSYIKAAEILCGLSEYFILSGKKRKGINIIYEYRNDKYNRYPAFKRELDSILSQSKIIQI